MRIIIAAAVALAVLALLGPPATYVLADGYPDFRDRSPYGDGHGWQVPQGGDVRFPTGAVRWNDYSGQVRFPGGGVQWRGNHGRVNAFGIDVRW
ncbi:MAG: hypothetical protein AB1733_02830 [Thermodesulfobacteriota bacterium]